MFLYQSETDTHFQCPSCGQRGSVATHLLDDALRDNAHVQISCTTCRTKFEPHAPAADTMAETPAEEADLAPPEETVQVEEETVLPDLHDLWRQHDDDDEDADADISALAENRSFPSWMNKNTADKNELSDSQTGKNNIDSDADAPPVEDEADALQSTDITDDLSSDDELISDDVMAARAELANDEDLINELKSNQWSEGPEDATTDTPTDGMTDGMPDEAAETEIDAAPDNIGDEAGDTLPDENKLSLLQRFMARLRKLFSRRPAEPEEPLKALPAPDADGLRVFGDDDFIDDAAFEEARHLAKVENAMAEDAKAENSEAEDVEAEDIKEDPAIEPDGEEGNAPTVQDDIETDIETDGEEDAAADESLAASPEDGVVAENDEPNHEADDVWQPIPPDERDLADEGTGTSLQNTYGERLAAPLSAAPTPKRLTALGFANLCLAVVLVALTALNSYVLLRDKPELNPFVEATPVKGAMIKLDNVGFEILSDPEGDSLIVSAQFSNSGEMAGLIDDYVIYLQDGNKRTLTSWTVVGGGQTIQAGGSRKVNSTLFAPPASVAHISVEYPAGN